MQSNKSGSRQHSKMHIAMTYPLLEPCGWQGAGSVAALPTNAFHANLAQGPMPTMLSSPVMQRQHRCPSTGVCWPPLWS